MRTHDMNIRAVAWTGAAIAATVIAVVIVVMLLLRHWEIPAGGQRLPIGYDATIDGPSLQSAPQADLANYRAEKRKLLESSGWVDARQGIVRIPVKDAMEVLAQQRAASAPKEAR